MPCVLWCPAMPPREFQLNSTSSAEIKLAVIGLGYVGLPLAVAFGQLMPVLGFDVDTRRIEDLRAGYDRTLETEISDLSAARLFTPTSDVADLFGCNVFIVAVPT